MENAQNNNIVKFEVGKKYYYRFACSYDTVVTVTVIKRTAKTITIDDDGEKLTRKIYILDGAEHVAIAHYSMAPTLDATRTQEALEASQKAAEARKAEEESKEEEERKTARETTAKVVEGAIALYTAMHPLQEGATTYAVIGSSEMLGLPGCSGDSLKVSIKAADKILGTLDIWQHAIRATSEYYGWYKKTDFAIHYIDENGEDSVYSGRYDIGDGEGGLLNHIRNFGEWHRTHEEFGKEKAIPDETNEILEFVKMLEKAA